MASGDKRPRKPSESYDVVEAFNTVISNRDQGRFPAIESKEEDIRPTNSETLRRRAHQKLEELAEEHADSDNEKSSFGNATEEYFLKREEVQRREKALGFDHHCTKEAEEWEVKADMVIQRFKKMDVRDIYDKEDMIEGYAGQKHKRIHGDRFLLNAPIIEKTRLYRAIQKMPKGAHLHIHFNANLLPEVLLNIAKKQTKHMYIMSDIPLNRKEAFERCRLRFSIISDSNHAQFYSKRPDLFTSPDASSHKSGEKVDEKEKHVMLYSKFREGFAKLGSDISVDEFLTRKIVFQADEAYSPHQTAKG